MKIRFLALFSLFLCNACQRKAALGPAADTMSNVAPPPMGASVYNDELKKEVALFDNVVNHRLDQRQLRRVVKGLMDGDQKLFSKDSKDADLVKLFLSLPELIRSLDTLSDNRKLWLKAKLLFLRRRFVEAAMYMSEVLKNEPDFIEARNWRARAIFFLGNPDLAVSELKKIVDESPKDSEAKMDALYLIGAIIYEANDLDKKRISIGIEAWQNYLAQKKSQPELKNELEASIADLKLRLEGQKNVVEIRDPFSPHKQNSPQKNEILKAFQEQKLLLCEELANQFLAKNYDVDVSIVKARTYFITDRLDEAVGLFEQIVQKKADYAPAFHYRGMAFMMKGNIEEAIASWKKTCELDPHYAKAHNLEQRIAVAQNMTGQIKIPTH
ncbi:MAG: tetratricopeptide repeat protein [Myxococcales bacterium]|nr:tetratricopeptide repeat protein [Myxococcales bacterium]USN49977.1 MAG: tetratricopeptide repeat protein [Myxococcales bacterium]